MLRCITNRVRKGVDGGTKGVDGETKGVDGETKGVDGETKGVDGETKGTFRKAPADANKLNVCICCGQKPVR